MATPAGRKWAKAREFALRLPEAWEDHPWGEVVAKVGKKVVGPVAVDLLEEWVEESYCNVAPKRLAAGLRSA